MEVTERDYIPAAGHDLFLPLYDPLMRLLGGDAVRRELIQQANIGPGQRVLDIGCGTGSLVLLIKRLHPNVEVIGLDPDPKALTRARKKTERASVSVRLDQGFANDLPYEDASVDRVVSSFMFHHLDTDQKLGMLRESRRVLKPTGLFTLLDFGGPEAGAKGYFARLFHTTHRLKDNNEDRVIELIDKAGFGARSTVKHKSMLFGLMGISFYGASVNC